MPADPSVALTILDLINLVGSLVSLILAIISIWLSLYFYHKSKDSEINSNKLLSKTEQQVSLMNKVTGRMLEKYVDYSTSSQLPFEVRQILESATEVRGSITPPAEANGQDIELMTTYIAIMYWSFIANLAGQGQMPDQLEALEAEEYAGLKETLEQSKHDFNTARTWLENADKSDISKSTALAYYDWFANNPDAHLQVRNTLEYYQALYSANNASR